MAPLPESPGSFPPAQYREHPVLIDCEGDAMVGIVSIPARPAKRGVLVIVGGPQYRAGSHRQFVLLARALAESGIPVLRFDYRGMGDSAGAPRDFERVSVDLRAAVDRFMAALPSLRDVVLWGLCDGATAAGFYAQHDPRVCGVVLLNPWVRTPDSIARASLRHYYRARLLDREFWRKVFAGRFSFSTSAHSLWRQAAAAAAPRQSALPDRMLAGLGAFPGRTLVILSGQDLTAREFCDAAASSCDGRRALAPERTRWHRLAEADHTFSCRAWRDQVASMTCDWVRSW